MPATKTIYVKVLKPEYLIIKASSEKAAAKHFNDKGFVVLATSENPLDDK